MPSRTTCTRKLPQHQLQVDTVGQAPICMNNPPFLGAMHAQHLQLGCNMIAATLRLDMDSADTAKVRMYVTSWLFVMTSKLGNADELCRKFVLQPYVLRPSAQALQSPKHACSSNTTVTLGPCLMSTAVAILQLQLTYESKKSNACSCTTKVQSLQKTLSHHHHHPAHVWCSTPPKLETLPASRPKPNHPAPWPRAHVQGLGSRAALDGPRPSASYGSCLRASHTSPQQPENLRQLLWQHGGQAKTTTAAPRAGVAASTNGLLQHCCRSVDEGHICSHGLWPASVFGIDGLASSCTSSRWFAAAPTAQC